jgi:hypothetical protein
VCESGASMRISEQFSTELDEACLENAQKISETNIYVNWNHLDLDLDEECSKDEDDLPLTGQKLKVAVIHNFLYLGCRRLIDKMIYLISGRN